MKTIQEILKMQDDLEEAMNSFLEEQGWYCDDTVWGQWGHWTTHPNAVLTNEEAFLMECRDAGVEVK